MEIINNYELRRPYKKGLKSKYLFLIHYTNRLHQVFIVNETERQLLQRVKSIMYHKKRNKIDYLNIYEIYRNDYLQFYGEYN